MSFAIEVPGEASPLGFQELCRTLQLASTSPDHAQRQSAGQQLSSWEQTQVDYYPLLQHAFLDKSLPREIRLLAIIQLKNGIDKHWRHHHTIDGAIQPAQKDVIRSNLYRGSVGEEDKQLAMHNALVIAKVTRIDFPQPWPEAMSNLVALLRDTKNDPFKLSGALTVLLRVVKELGTARLRRSQTALQSVTPELVYLLGEIYTSSTETWNSALSSGQGDAVATEMAMSNSLTAFKTLRRLLITGYEHPHKDSAVQQAWGLSQVQFVQFIGYASQESSVPASLLDIVGKHMLQFTKLHVDMATTHPASFVSLPNSMDLVRSYWGMVVKFAEIFPKSSGLRQSGAEGDHKFGTEGQWLEKIALKGLLLCRACIRMINQPQQTFKYRTKEDRAEQDALLQHAKDDLLKDDFIVQMANVIISNFLVFREADLQAWEEDPEEWEQEEESGGNAWEWEVRPCAEQVLHLLLVSYKHLLVEPLLAYFATARSPQADIMSKESVYTALGLAAEHLENRFDFDEFLKTTLVADVQQQGPLCTVLRRRISILISQWVKVSVAKESLPTIYQIFQHFFNPDDHTNDIVVRITGARQFKDVANQFIFDGEGFAPYAEEIIVRLIRLLQEISVDETKLAILDTIKVLIERMETHVNRYAEFIISSLPAVWDAEGEMGYMLKSGALTILQALVMSMGRESQKFHSVIIPLIADVVREDSQVFVYLIDEALELWVNILYQSSSPISAELAGLVEPALRLLSAQTDRNPMYITIAGSYIILAPQLVLEERWRQPLLMGLSQTLQPPSSREEQRSAARYIGYLLRYAQEFGQIDGVKVVVQDLITCGLMKEMFEGIHDAYSARQTSGPKRKTPKVNNLTLTDYFSILSRIAVADPSILVDILATFGPVDQVWLWLSEEWFGNFDCISDDMGRKLNLLGLTRLMELGQPVQDLVLAKLQDYFSMWIGVISPILSEDEPEVDLLILTSSLEATEWDTHKDVRERALTESDPVRTVHALHFVKNSLANLVQRVGGEQTFREHYAVNVDSDVLQSFERLGQPLQNNI